MSPTKTVLITGGAGFIGSHLIHFFLSRYPDYHIVNIDNLTYASNLEIIRNFKEFSNYKFYKKNICHKSDIEYVFEKHNFNSVIHLAAETHVDRSIENPFKFAKTNILGTINLLEVTLAHIRMGHDFDFLYHISTDEVFGQLGSSGSFKEGDRYNPRSPYAASKASSDHFVKAYYNTYNLPVLLSHCSNNYGPRQHLEKLIPKVITNTIKSTDIPVYGDGSHVRDWLYVADHVDAVDTIFHRGKIGNSYNIGGNHELDNLTLVKQVVALTDEFLGRPRGSSDYLIKLVEDRPGHDYRYSLNSKKIKMQLNWESKTTLEIGLKKTIKSYMDNC